LQDQETKKDLIRLRIPIEKIKETVETLLPAGHDPKVADRIAERAANLIATAYEKDRVSFIGCKPSTLMAATIYIATMMEKGVHITQNKIAKALDTYVLSFKKRANQIENLLGLDVTNLYQHKRYVCPVCGEPFPCLNALKAHLWSNNIKPSSNLKTSMFNEDGILVDENVLKRIKQYF